MQNLHLNNWMPQLSPEFIDFRHFWVQTKKIQAHVFDEVDAAMPVCPNWESGMEMVLSLLSWVSAGFHSQTSSC